MKVSKIGIDLIKKYEGCRLKAYQCSAGRWTIGYGNTFYKDNTPVKEGDIITQQQAEELLPLVIEKEYQPMINRWLKKEVNQDQFDALICFCYNTPAKAKKVCEMLNNNINDEEIKSYWLSINSAKDPKTNMYKKIDGLVKRRKEEVALFFSVKDNQND